MEYVNAVGMESSSLANPTTTLGVLGRACFVAEGWLSGQNSTTGTSPLVGWTNRSESDDGTFIDGSYSYDTIGTADVTVGSSQTIEDWLMLAVAVSEVSAAGSVASRPRSFLSLGAGRL